MRDFAAAMPWPIWAKSAQGELRYANAAYAKATEATGVAGCDPAQPRTARKRPARRSQPGADRQFGLHRTAADRGRRRAPRLRRPCAQPQRRQRRHRHRRQRGQQPARGAGADGGGASPHPRSALLRRSRVRRPAAAGVLQRFLSPPVGSRPHLSRRQSRRFQRARSPARGAQGPRAAGFPRLESQAARGLSRGRTDQGYLVSARRPRASASSPRRTRKAASPICSTTSPKASSWRGASTA